MGGWERTIVVVRRRRLGGESKYGVARVLGESGEYREEDDDRFVAAPRKKKRQPVHRCGGRRERNIIDHREVQGPASTPPPVFLRDLTVAMRDPDARNVGLTHPGAITISFPLAFPRDGPTFAIRPRRVGPMWDAADEADNLAHDEGEGRWIALWP